MGRYIVAMDTGGSKTRLCVFDKNGTAPQDHHCRGLGAATEADLSGLLCELKNLDGIPFSEVESVVINVGAADAEQIRRAVASMFPNACTEAFRESSGVIMKAICTMEQADVLLMAGTGSIALCIGRSGSIITDGWSPNTGDKGSGYWIGLEAISRSLIALEQTEMTPLAACITGRTAPFSASEDTLVQMRLRDAVRSRLMPLERAKVAAYTRVAAEYARAGDAMAREIFADAGKLLANTVLRGVKIAQCTPPVRIFVSGGLVHCMDLWGPSFEKSLKEQIDCTIKTGEADMIQGALYYAIHFDTIDKS